MGSTGEGERPSHKGAFRHFSFWGRVIHSARASARPRAPAPTPPALARNCSRSLRCAQGRPCPKVAAQTEGGAGARSHRPGMSTGIAVLPLDAWQHISDFLQSPAVSRLCRGVWQRLRGQHLRFPRSAAPSDIEAALRRHRTALRTAKLQTRLPDGALPPLASALREAAALHTLQWDLSLGQVGEGDPKALAVLRGARALRTLRLHLQWNLIGDAGAQALAALRDAPALQTLQLCLACADIGEAGLRALAGLAAAPRLQDLHLDVQRNRLDASAVHALAQGLGAAPALRALHLDVACNRLGDGVGDALSALRTAPALQTLRVNLQVPSCRLCPIPDAHMPLPPLPSHAALLLSDPNDTRNLRSVLKRGNM